MDVEKARKVAKKISADHSGTWAVYTRGKAPDAATITRMEDRHQIEDLLPAANDEAEFIAAYEDGDML